MSDGVRVIGGWIRRFAGVAVLAVWMGPWLGCAAVVLPLDEIDPAPIALLYWDDETSRRRKELLEQAQLPPGARAGSGVATPESLGQFFGVKREGALQLLARLAQFPGRLSLLDPRTGRLERVQAAWPDSKPLAWSADHKELLFTSDHKTGKYQLYVYDVESRNVRRLTRSTESHLAGDVSDDGRYVFTGVRARGKELSAHLYLTGPHGVDPEVVFDGAFGEVCFVPGGDDVLLVRADVRSGRRNAPPLLVVRSLDDREAPERVVARGRHPAVSANGEWVVYSGALSGGGWRLVRIRPDGAGRAPVGKGARDETMPAVSPDGRHVAYVTEEGEFDRLFVRRIDGSGDRVLLDDGSVAWPVW
ncbi:MAG: TolB family protein [Myxococcota bacterium]